MQILRGSIPTLYGESVVTVGSFDGVHLGHQALLHTLTETAHSEGLQSVVVTFDPHPRIALGRSEGFQLLTDDAEKAALLARYGVDVLVILPFQEELRMLSGEQFVREVLCEQLQASVLVAGYNHRFGHDRIAASDLRIDSLRHIEVGPCTLEGARISSTVIRERIAVKDYAYAEQLLGHPIKLTEK